MSPLPFRIALYASLGALGYAFVARGLRPRLLDLPTGPGPTGPNPGPLPPPPPFAGPIIIAADPAPLVPGAVYLAAIVIDGALSILASKAKVADQARKLGFTNVAVVEEPAPPAAPPLAPADYYVTATYAGAPQAIARNQGGGRVHVVDVRRIS